MKKHFTHYLFLLFPVYLCAQSGDILSIENSLKQRNVIIFYGGFEEGFNTDSWKK